MNDTVRGAIVGLLSILAVALAAATLDATTFAPGSGGGDGPGLGGRGEPGMPIPTPQDTAPPGGSINVPFLSELTLLVAVLFVIAVLVYLYYNWREAFRAAVAVATVVVVGAIVVWLLSEIGALPEDPFEGMRRGNPFGGGGDGGGGTSGEATRPSLPSLMLVVGLALALGGTLLAIVRSSPEEETEDESGDEPAPPGAAAVGRVAGRAADRLESTGGDANEVYRAWREMTALLDVPDPETSTPGEFADAAVAAGMDREDVAELTRLFEDVRYGGDDPSPAAEDRAVAIFRRIEDRYAEAEP